MERVKDRSGNPAKQIETDSLTTLKAWERPKNDHGYLIIVH